MALATVERVDGRLVLALSEEGQQELKLIEGSQMDVQRIEHGLKLRRRRYTLDELLAQCDYSMPLGDEEREWVEAPSAGRELL